MPIERPLAADDPEMIAWNAYKASDDYANTRRWAQRDAHVDGSLWAAFDAGYRAALAALPGKANTGITHYEDES